MGADFLCSIFFPNSNSIFIVDKAKCKTYSKNLTFRYIFRSAFYYAKRQTMQKSLNWNRYLEVICGNLDCPHYSPGWGGEGPGGGKYLYLENKNGCWCDNTIFSITSCLLFTERLFDIVFTSNSSQNLLVGKKCQI